MWQKPNASLPCSHPQLNHYILIYGICTQILSQNGTCRFTEGFVTNYMRILKLAERTLLECADVLLRFVCYIARQLTLLKSSPRFARHLLQVTTRRQTQDPEIARRQRSCLTCKTVNSPQQKTNYVHKNKIKRQHFCTL